MMQTPSKFLRAMHWVLRLTKPKIKIEEHCKCMSDSSENDRKPSKLSLFNADISEISQSAAEASEPGKVKGFATFLRKNVQLLKMI